MARLAEMDLDPEYGDADCYRCLGSGEDPVAQHQDPALTVRCLVCGGSGGAPAALCSCGTRWPALADARAQCELVGYQEEAHGAWLELRNCPVCGSTLTVAIVSSPPGGRDSAPLPSGGRSTEEVAA